MPSTARTRPRGATAGGPARRTQPRKAVLNAEKPIAYPAGTVLTFYLKQFHGGWNSDDNQSHNLGRFRLAITAAADAEAAVFGHWRTTVPEWAEANARVEALWRTHPEGTSQLVLEEREELRG